MSAGKLLKFEDVKEYIRSNNYILISTSYKNAHTKMATVCPNGHEYNVTFANFKGKGARCGICSGNYKKTIEEVKEAFRKEGYSLVSDTYKDNHTKIEVLCPLNHRCLLTYTGFVHAGNRCTTCSGLKQYTIEQVREVVTNNCPKGHLWQVSVGHFVSHKTRCPICSNNGTSKPQIEVFNFVKQFYPDAIENDRSLISPKQLDIFIPSLNLAIEYCGLYWHSEPNRDRLYHHNKMTACNEKGIRLITIFEDEWLERQDQVKNFLLSVLGKNEIKLMARKTELREVPKKEASSFLEQNHIQGSTTFRVALGLYHQNELVGVITGNQHHRQGHEYLFVLNRLAFKSNVSISGGSSKLLKALIDYAKSNGFDTMISWSDNRWSEGKVYEAMGFELTEELGPDYSYVTGQTRVSKQSCQKKHLIKKGAKGDMSMTEKELALTLGLQRIWDCGKKRWSIKL